MNKLLKQFLIFCCLVTLYGCATVQSTTVLVGQPMSWEARSAALNQIQTWTTNGSVSIQYAQRTDLASLKWNQQNERYQFLLFGPLGFGKVDILGKPGRIMLTQSNTPPISAATPELLMQQQLGWKIPVQHLYYWGRGLPAPGIPAKTTFDAYHHLIKLKQAQWEIEYLEYMPVGSVDLPRKMQMTSEKLKVKLMMREWIK